VGLGGGVAQALVKRLVSDVRSTAWFFRQATAYTGARILKALNPRAIEAQRLAFLSFFHPVNRPPPDLRALMEVELNQVSVGRCLDVISEDAGGVPLHLFSGTPENRGDEITSHPLLDLLAQPSPDVPRRAWWQYVYADAHGAGDHFSYVHVDARARPASFSRLRPDEVTVNPDPTGQHNIGSYDWDTMEGQSTLIQGVGASVRAAGIQNIPRERMFHVKRRHPFTVLRGYGQVARLRHYLLLDQAIQDWDWNRWAQGIPTEYIMFFNGQFQPGQREEIEARLQRKMVGPKGDNYMLLEANDSGERQWEVTTFPRATEKELATLDKEQRIQYRIAEAMGVPPSKLQDFSQSTRIANADAMERAYWEDTIMGLHTLVLDFMNSIFIPMYYGRGLFLEYDYAGVRALQQSALERAQIHQVYLSQGVMSRNEAREQIGMERVTDPLMDAFLHNGQPLGANPLAGFLPGGNGREPMEPDEEPEIAERARAKVVPLRRKTAVLQAPLLQLDEEKEIFDKLVRAKLRLMVLRAAEQHLELAGIAGAFDLQDPQVLQFVDTMVVRLAEEVVTNTDNMVRARVAEAIADGLSVTEMRAMLQDAFTVRRQPWQLDRIARTETHQAQEGGSWHASRQNGVEFKRWITARDSRVRGLEPDDDADHASMEEMGPLPLSVPFVDTRSGARLMFPGDRGGAVSGADTINCRCTWASDFSHLDLAARPARQKMARSLDDVWMAKAERRATLELDLLRTLRRYFLGMERRALEAYDAQTGAAGPERAQTGGQV